MGRAENHARIGATMSKLAIKIVCVALLSTFAAACATKPAPTAPIVRKG